MNPYASFIGSRDPQEIIASTASRLKEMTAPLSDSKLNEAPAPGKWSAREIVCHLADCEITFGFRLRQTLAEPNHVMQPFDQERWAANYAAYDAQSALATFSALRDFNMKLIASLPPEAFEKTANHPERGDMTFRTIVETMAGHDLNHLGQIERIVAVR